MPWIITENSGRRFLAEHIETIDTRVIGKPGEGYARGVGLIFHHGAFDNAREKRTLITTAAIIEWIPDSEARKYQEDQIERDQQ